MFLWVGKEANDVIVIGRVVSAELRLYWPRCVCNGRVALYLCRSYDSDRFCHINNVLIKRRYGTDRIVPAG